MKNDHKKRRNFWDCFPFSDDFLLFFLPMLDDEAQMRLAALEEDDDPLFDPLGFEGWPEDDFEEDLGSEEF